MSRQSRRTIVKKTGLLLSGAVPLLTGCGPGAKGKAVSWSKVEPTAVPTEPPAVAQVQPTEPAPTEPAPTETAQKAPAVPAHHDQSAILSAEQLKEYQPNEAGQILILEYHVITRHKSNIAQFVRHADQMRGDLKWLAEHNFTITPLMDIVSNTIRIPPGRRPVALTFDDSTSTQFRFLQDDQGNLKTDANGEPIVDPDCAVGIIEQAAIDYPELGKGGHFAPLKNNGFAHPEEIQLDMFADKLKWLVAHGYEVGNHTADHSNLTDLETNHLLQTITQPMIEHNEILGAGSPGNLCDILTLPYGTYPNRDKHLDQQKMLDNGWTYEGQKFSLRGALLVGANPAAAPSTVDWDRLSIARVQAWDEVLPHWWNLIETDQVPLYVSDGNPNTIVVPTGLEKSLAMDRLKQQGVQVMAYDRDSGETVDVPFGQA